MSTPPEPHNETWIDHGPVKGKRQGRSATSPSRSQKRPKSQRPLDSVIEEFERILGRREGPRALKRYEAALEAFEAHRYKDAQRLLQPMTREFGDVFAVREMLGLCLYRGGQWKRALVELERSLELNRTWIFNHAVIEDCHRALGNHADVERYWQELAAASPHPELLAEGRMVMAGSLADRGDLEGALKLMSVAERDLKSPKEHDLRQWFVIADLYDRSGNTILARRFLERIAAREPDFVEVAERLATLGG